MESFEITVYEMVCSFYVFQVVIFFYIFGFTVAWRRFSEVTLGQFVLLCLLSIFWPATLAYQARHFAQDEENWS